MFELSFLHWFFNQKNVIEGSNIFLATQRFKIWFFSQIFIFPYKQMKKKIKSLNNFLKLVVVHEDKELQLIQRVGTWKPQTKLLEENV
jgi:hypothetical protein